VYNKKEARLRRRRGRDRLKREQKTPEEKTQGQFVNGCAAMCYKHYEY